MNIKSFGKGAVIFRQGDAGDCMYDIQSGRVGIFDHYGEPDEKKIAELYVDQIRNLVSYFLKLGNHFLCIICLLYK